MRIASTVLAAALFLPPCLAMAADAPTAGTAGYFAYSGVVVQSQSVRTVDGKEPPFRPEAKALLDKRIASQDTLRPWADVSAACLPPGMPRASLSVAPYPFEILQTPGQVTFILEAMNVVRRIHLNRDHPNYVEPSWNGDAVGHWEGDTLVIDTIGLNAKSTMDKIGTPMSTAMHITERIRRNRAGQSREPDDDRRSEDVHHALDDAGGVCPAAARRRNYGICLRGQPHGAGRGRLHHQILAVTVACRLT